MASPFRDFAAIVAIKIGSGSQTPGNGDCMAVIQDTVDFEATYEQNENNSIRGTFQKFPNVSGSRMGRLRFAWYLKGSGTAGTAPEWGDALKACRLNEGIVGATSVTYKPLIAEVSVATLWYLLDGIKFAIQDAVGTVKFTGERGKLWRAEAEFIGSLLDPTDTPLSTLTPTLDTTAPVAFQGVAVTILGVTTAPCRSLSFDLGNVNSMRDDIAGAAGYLGAGNSDRRTTAQVVFELPTVAAHDIWTKIKNGTTGTLSHGALGSAGNIVQFTGAAGEFTNLKLSSDAHRVYVTADVLMSAPAGQTEGDDFKLILT